MTNTHTFNVSEQHVGCRLDQFLVTCFPTESRARVQHWLSLSSVQKNNIIIEKCNTKLQLHDVITVQIPPAIDTHIQPQDIPLNIVYEDDDVIVINKPAGLVVHPAPGHHDETLVNALLAHCGESLSGIGGVKRPGIVHRLDKDTTGLMVVAKNDYAHTFLSAQFARHENGEGKQLKRAYKALVFGKPKSRTTIVDTQIGRHPRNRQKMTVLSSGGKQAITHINIDYVWQHQASGHVFSMLDCTLDTGRTHQIRVHCQSLLCPLIGDTVYGKKSVSNQKHLPSSITSMQRQALHAYQLAFIHPKSGDVCRFECDLPLDMQAIIDTLSTPFYAST